MKTNFKDAALFAQDGVDVVMLCRGETITGKPFYAFLKIKPSRVTAFEQAQAESPRLDLNDFGEVLQFDYAHTPPPQVIQEMRQKFGNQF